MSRLRDRREKSSHASSTARITGLGMHLDRVNYKGSDTELTAKASSVGSLDSANHSPVSFMEISFHFFE